MKQSLSNVDSLAIQHFEELKDAWKFERDEHLRLNEKNLELCDIVQQLESRLGDTQEELNLEVMRWVIIICCYYIKISTLFYHRSKMMLLASENVNSPSIVVGAVRSWIPIELDASVRCCIKLNHRWLILDENNNSTVVEREDLLDHLAEEYQHVDDSSAGYKIMELSPNTLHSLQWEAYHSAHVVPIFSRCIWVVKGIDSRKAIDSLESCLCLFSTATQLCMESLARQMENTEKDFKIVCLTTAVQLGNLLTTQYAPGKDHSANSVWPNISGVIKQAINSIERTFGGPSSLQYEVDVFRIYAKSEEFNFSLPITALSSVHDQLIKIMPGSATMMAISKNKIINKSFSGLKNGANVELYDANRDHSDSLFIRGDFSSALVIVPITFCSDTNSSDVEAPVGFVSFTALYENSSLSSPLSLTDLTHIELLCTACTPCLRNWMVGHELETLRGNKVKALLDCSHNATVDSFNKAWSLYVALDGYNPDDSASYFMEKMRCEKFSQGSGIFRPDSKNGLNLSSLAATFLNCTWASMILVGSTKDLVVMNECGSVSHANGATMISKGSSGDGLEEKRLEQLFNLVLLQCARSEDSTVSATDKLDEIYTFEGLDIKKSIILMSMLSSEYTECLNGQGADSWTVSMLVIRLDDIISCKKSNKGVFGRSLVIFGGKEWHPKRDWDKYDGINIVSKEFVSNLKILLSTMHSARISAERVALDIPTATAALHDYKSRHDTLESQYTSVDMLSSRLNKLLNMEKNAMLSNSFNIQSQIWHCIADTLGPLLQSKERVPFYICLCDGFSDYQWVLDPAHRESWTKQQSRETLLLTDVNIEIYGFSNNADMQSVGGDFSDFSITLKLPNCTLFTELCGQTISFSNDINKYSTNRAVCSWIEVLRSFFTSLERVYSREIVLNKLLYFRPVAATSEMVSDDDKNFETSPSLSASCNIDELSTLGGCDTSESRGLFSNTFKFASAVCCDSLSATPQTTDSNGTEIFCNLTDIDDIWQRDCAAGAAYLSSKSYWSKALSSVIQLTNGLPIHTTLLPLGIFTSHFVDSSTDSECIGRDLLCNDLNSDEYGTEYLPRDIMEYIVEDIRTLANGCDSMFMSAMSSVHIEKYLLLRYLGTTDSFSPEKRREFHNRFSPSGVSLLVKGPQSEKAFNGPSAAYKCTDAHTRKVSGASVHYCSSTYYAILHLSMPNPLSPTSLNRIVHVLRASMLPLCSLSTSILLQESTQDAERVLSALSNGTSSDILSANKDTSSACKGEIEPDRMYDEVMRSNWKSLIKLMNVSSGACQRILNNYDTEITSNLDKTAYNREGPKDYVAYIASEEGKLTQCDKFESRSLTSVTWPNSITRTHVLVTSLPVVVIYDSSSGDPFDGEIKESTESSGVDKRSRITAALIESPKLVSPTKRGMGYKNSPVKNVSFAANDISLNDMSTAATTPTPQSIIKKSREYFLRICYYLPVDEVELVSSQSETFHNASLPNFESRTSSINPFRSFSPTSSFGSPENKEKGRGFDPISPLDQNQDGSDSLEVSNKGVLFAVVFLPLSLHSMSLLCDRGAQFSELRSFTDENCLRPDIYANISCLTQRLYQRIEWVSKITLLEMQYWIKNTYKLMQLQHGNRWLIKGHAHKGASFSDWTNDNIKDLFEKAKMVSTHNISDENEDNFDALSKNLGFSGMTGAVDDSLLRDSDLNMEELIKMKQLVVQVNV